MDNLSLQVDEIEALSSIYDKELTVLDEYSRIYSVSISENKSFKTDLVITLPQTYPGEAAPKYQINAVWITSDDRRHLHENFDKIHTENLGESILYMWIEYAREFVKEKQNARVVATGEVSHSPSPQRMCESDIVVPTISHGEPITDRRSTFQAHTAVVINTQQVEVVQEALLQNRKISNASHNIMAYRIFDEATSIFYQDCDDDGETAAGGRMLHLLQILDVKNVVVIVSRWYGGILLGPDRFKHINNAARNVLVQEGFVNTATNKHKRTK